VVPLLVAEPARDTLLERLRADPVIVLWWGTSVECVSALARREREGALAPRASSNAVNRLRRLVGAAHEVLPSEPVRSTAERLLRVHALRAGDALQLAAALVAAQGEPGSLEVVCLDERLTLAAEREGFPVSGGV